MEKCTLTHYLIILHFCCIEGPNDSILDFFRTTPPRRHQISWVQKVLRDRRASEKWTWKSYLRWPAPVLRYTRSECAYSTPKSWKAIQVQKFIQVESHSSCCVFARHLISLHLKKLTQTCHSEVQTNVGRLASWHFTFPDTFLSEPVITWWSEEREIKRNESTLRFRSVPVPEVAKKSKLFVCKLEFISIK